MKISKFDETYKKSYKMFLNENAPIPTNATTGEGLLQPQQEQPPTKEQIKKTPLPDPKDVIGVKTDLLKMFKDFFNIDQQRQEEFKRSLAAKSVDDKNAEELIDQLKQFITAGEKPKESSI
jgi:hypothetical protein